MSNILISLLISLIAGLSTIFGAFLIYFKIPQEKYNKFITFYLSFAAAVMISISIFDLIPESFFNIINNNGIIKSFIILIMIFSISFIIIKKISNQMNSIDDLYKLGILNMIVLILHNLPEGVLTFMSSFHDLSLGIKVSIAIMLHNIPEGISIAIPIYYSTNSHKKALLYALVSGLSEPFGAIIAFLFLKPFINKILISYILIVVAFLMIILSIEEILPKTIMYKEKESLLFGITFGIIIVIINVFFFN